MISSSIRKKFPVLMKKKYGKSIVYFDNACSVLKPKKVIDAVASFYSNLGVCAGNRSSHRLSLEVQELIDEAREKMRKFINAASTKEIIWTKNATDGINLVASSFPFSQKRNKVVITALEHHSNILPFYEQSKRRGFELNVVMPGPEGMIDLGILEKVIDSKTALVSVSHMSNVTGLENRIKEIAALAHRKGAMLLVDDAQYMATHSEDVQKNGIDFLVFSGHKIGGPFGTGILYAKEKMLKKMHPCDVGGGTVRMVNYKKENSIVPKYLSYPNLFEAGIQDYAGIVGLGAAVDFLEEIDQSRIEKHVRNLSAYAFLKLKKFPEVGFAVDYGKNIPCSIVSIFFKDKRLSLNDFNIFLNNDFDGHIIAVRIGTHCAQPLHQVLGVSQSLRLSFFAYNSKKEIDLFVNALAKFLRKK